MKPQNRSLFEGCNILGLHSAKVLNPAGGKCNSAHVEEKTLAEFLPLDLKGCHNEAPNRSLFEGFSILGLRSAEVLNSVGEKCDSVDPQKKTLAEFLSLYLKG